MSLSKSLLSAGILAALLFPKTTYASDFPMLGNDQARTGYVKEYGPAAAKEYWAFGFDELKKIASGFLQGENAEHAVIKNGAVFAFTEAGVLALDLKTGAAKWLSERLGEEGGIAADEERVYVTTKEANKIYALRQTDGKILWQASTKESMSHSLPLIAAGRLFIGDDSGSLYAFDAKTGKEVWEKTLDQEIHSSPAFGENLVFVGTEGDNASVVALKPESGEIVWQFPIDKMPRSSERVNLFHATPAYFNGKVFIGGENWYFYALSAKDGSLLWKREFTGWFTGAPAVDETNLYVGNWNGYFYALSQEGGATLWQYPIEQDGPFELTSSPGGGMHKQGPNSWPIATRDKVFFGTSNGYFYALDKFSGQVVWKEKYGHSWPVLADKILIIPVRPPQDALKGQLLVAISDFPPLASGATKPVKQNFSARNFLPAQITLPVLGALALIALGLGTFLFIRARKARRIR